MGVDFVKAPAQMAPAEGERDRAAPALVGKPAEAAIAVHLQGAAEPGQVGRRPGRLAVAGIDIGHGRRPMSERGTVVGRVAPEPALARSAEAALQGGQWRVIGEHPGMPDHMVEDEIAQRPQPLAGLADPVAQGGAVELDALPGEDLALPVERDAVAVLGHQHLDQQRLSGQAAGDDARRRRLLVNALLTAPAGIAGPDGHQHPELGRHDVEPLAPVLADPPHLLVATWAMAVGKVQHLLDPLQVRRQVAAVAAPLGMRLAATRGWVVVARRRWSGWRRRESQGQLPGVDMLGALAEAGPAQVVDDLLQRYDARLGHDERGPQLRYIVG